MLLIDPGSGPVSPQAIESTPHAVTPPPAPATSNESTPQASYVLKYAQNGAFRAGSEQTPSEGITSAFSKPVTGANIWGVGLSANKGSEFEFTNGPEGRQVTGSTTSSSLQANYNLSAGKGAFRSQQTLQEGENGATLTRVNTFYQQDDNGVREGQTSETITNDPNNGKEQKRADTTADPSLARSIYQNTSFNLAQWSPSTPSGSVASKTFSGTAGPASGSVTFSGLGYDTSAGASAGITNNALVAQADGSAEVYLGKVSASGSINLPDHVSVGGQGSAEVGAGVNGSAQAIVDPAKGSIDGDVNASGFVGAKAQGAASADVGPLDTSAQGDVGAGLGGSVDANVGIEKGKLNFDLGVQAYLGIGGGANLSFSVNVPQVAQDAVHDVSSVGSGLANGASDAWHDVSSFL